MSEGRPEGGAKAGLGFLLAGIVVVTLNLRGAITGVGPLLPEIQEELGLSSGLAGILSALPLFAFAFVSPFAAGLARRMGIERALLLALVVLVAGMVLRYLPPAGLLYFGTALIGTGIALCNVLVPGLIRRDFTDKLAAVTALFTMGIVVCGGLGSALAVPLAALGGWRLSLLAWVVPAVIGIVIWLPQVTRDTRPASSGGIGGHLWRSSLAWQVSFFMGLQSAAFYVLIAWFPAMLAEQGIGAAMAGWYLSIFQVFILLACIVVPMLIARAKDQTLIGAGVSAFIVAGYAGLLLAPASALLWTCLIGIGCGGSLVLALTLLSLRTRTTQQTVALSGMAQAVGYFLAAVTPVVLGVTRDMTGGWNLGLLIMVVLGALQVVSGYLCGRARSVGP